MSKKIIADLKDAYKSFLKNDQIPQQDKEEITKLLKVAYKKGNRDLDKDDALHLPCELIHAWSMINDNKPQDIDKVRHFVNSSGELIGFGQYEKLDLNWVEAITQLLTHYHDDQKAKFVSEPPSIEIADTTSIAIVGDWGAGNIPANKVANAVKQQKPDYTIHLGDVYYAGTPKEEEDNFLNSWPTGTNGSFALNSNHEMYAGGIGYFDVLLKKPAFQQQKGASYFSLQNKNWIIVGLDTAYYADKRKLYQYGHLNHTQLNFLQSVKDSAIAGNKRVIVLSHHHALDLDGSIPSKVNDDPLVLWNIVTSILGSRLAYWYWGHIHAGVAYHSVNGILGRCCGHGSIPYGKATLLDNNPLVAWRESNLAEPQEDSLRINNGFVLLNLKGNSISEQFIDENNNIQFKLKTTRH
jgi:hypothetical protein